MDVFSSHTLNEIMTAEYGLIRNLAILGFGTMGQGIAQVASMAGCRVKFFDINRQVMENGYKSITNQSSKQDKIRIYPCDTMNEAISDAELIIETITENLDKKRNLYHELSTAIKNPNVIISSNTSSFCISEFSRISKRPSHMVGMHFFNPVPKMKLVEMITLSETLSEVSNSVELFITRVLGKELVRCKDTSGFIVNRLLIPYMMDAINMAENSIASIHDIDMAMKLGAGHPIGPFSLMDLIGLDVIKEIIDNLHKNDRNDSRFKSSYLLNQMINDGKLGRKTGQGFFVYKNRNI